MEEETGGKDKIEVWTTAKGEIMAKVRIGHSEGLVSSENRIGVIDSITESFQMLKDRFPDLNVRIGGKK